MFAITTSETQNAALDGWHAARTGRDDRVSNLCAYLHAAASSGPMVEAVWGLENALVMLRRGALGLSPELTRDLMSAAGRAFERLIDRLPLDFDDVSDGFAATLDLLAASAEFGSVPRPLPNFPRRELHHRSGLFRAQLEAVARRAELQLLAEGKGSSAKVDDALGNLTSSCVLLPFRCPQKQPTKGGRP